MWLLHCHSLYYWLWCWLFTFKNGHIRCFKITLDRRTYGQTDTISYVIVEFKNVIIQTFPPLKCQKMQRKVTDRPTDQHKPEIKGGPSKKHGAPCDCFWCGSMQFFLMKPHANVSVGAPHQCVTGPPRLCHQAYTHTHTLTFFNLLK